MSNKEFKEHFGHWKDNWYIKYRLLDINFETYMYMQGLSKEEYNKLNNSKNVKN